MKVNVPPTELISKVIDACGYHGGYLTDGLSTIYVLKNGDIKVVYLNGDVVLIPYEKEKE